MILRSFSKAYGLANLRIGYLICSKEFKQIYLKNITTNEYSGISCLIAKKMINNYKYIEENIQEIIAERELLAIGLEKLGIRTIESFSNTLFTKSYFDHNFIKYLDENDISVVPVYDKNNNLHIRIAVQSRKINKEFLKKIEEIISNKNVILGIYDD